MYECPSILTSGAQKAGTIGTLEAPFDSPERWKDDGADRGAIGAMWYVCTHHTPFVRCSAKTKIIPCTQSIFCFRLCFSAFFAWILVRGSDSMSPGNFAIYLSWSEWDEKAKVDSLPVLSRGITLLKCRSPVPHLASAAAANSRRRAAAAGNRPSL